MNYYAQIFGVSLKELRKLERAFVTKMGFDFYVNDELFEQYKGYSSIELKELIKQHKEKGKVIKEEREEIKMFTWYISVYVYICMRICICIYVIKS